MSLYPRRIKLSDRQASAIATADLGYRVPASTVRSWKHRNKVSGGPGWVDGEDLVRHLGRLRHAA